jgi:hypothetical protein
VAPDAVLATGGGPAPTGGPDATWADLLGRFHVEGDRLTTPVGAPAALAGTIAHRWERALAAVVDEPAPGTAFIAVEGRGEHLSASVWLALYGPDGPALADSEAPRWQHVVDSLPGGVRS